VSRRKKARIAYRTFRAVVAVANAVVGLYGAGAIVAHFAGILTGGR
jgi:hypothetical protein